MNWKAFLEDTAWRCVSTCGEVFLAMVGSNAIGITAVDWVGVASVTAMSAVVTVVKCLVVEARKHTHE